MRLLPHTGVYGLWLHQAKPTSDQGEDLSLFSSLRGGPATRAMDHWCENSLGGSSFSWLRGGPARAMGHLGEQRRVDAETFLLYTLTSIQDVQDAQDAQPARSRAQTGDLPASSASPRLGAHRFSTLQAGGRPGSLRRPQAPRRAVLRFAGPGPSPAYRVPPAPSRLRFVLLAREFFSFGLTPRWWPP